MTLVTGAVVWVDGNNLGRDEVAFVADGELVGAEREDDRTVGELHNDGSGLFHGVSLSRGASLGPRNRGRTSLYLLRRKYAKPALPADGTGEGRPALEGVEMTERVLGDGAKTCDDKKCEVCSELRESKTKKKEASK